MDQGPRRGPASGRDGGRRRAVRDAPTVQPGQPVPPISDVDQRGRPGRHAALVDRHDDDGRGSRRRPARRDGQRLPRRPGRRGCPARRGRLAAPGSGRLPGLPLAGQTLVIGTRRLTATVLASNLTIRRTLTAAGLAPVIVDADAGTLELHCALLRWARPQLVPRPRSAPVADSDPVAADAMGPPTPAGPVDDLSLIHISE